MTSTLPLEALGSVASLLAAILHEEEQTTQWPKEKVQKDK
jgi:hypothetical protein